MLVTRIRCVVIVLARRTGRRAGRIGSVSTTRRNNPGYMIIRIVQVVNIIGILVDVAARRRVVIRMTAVGVAVMVLARVTTRVLGSGSSRPELVVVVVVTLSGHVPVVQSPFQHKVHVTSGAVVVVVAWQVW